MIVESAVVVVHDMLMNRAVSMHVRNHMALRMPLIESMAVRITVMVVAVLSRGSLRCRNERALKGKRHRRRHHDDDAETMQQ